MTTATPQGSPNGRLLSIDALRGFDMFWITGGDRLIAAITAAWGTDVARSLGRQFEHVEWEGFRFYDLIFPLFLFLVGVVLPFSLSKYAESASDRGPAYQRIARRTLALFALGLLCNGILQFNWSELRVAGVLQRIALCYGAAAILTLTTSTRVQALLLPAILLGYWALLANVAAPGGQPGDLSKEGNLAGWIDRNYLPGKILEPYYGYGDNEGLISTIPAVGTTLLGVLAGTWLRTSQTPWRKVAGLLGAGAISLAVGTTWSTTFPIIKNLWTSSFVLVAGGWSLILLGLFYAVIDVLGYRRWAFFFIVIGANAITIYVVPRFVDFERIAQFFLGGVIRVAETRIAPGAGEILAIVGLLAAQWLFLLFLYRHQIFLRV